MLKKYVLWFNQNIKQNKDNMMLKTTVNAAKNSALPSLWYYLYNIQNYLLYINQLFYKCSLDENKRVTSCKTIQKSHWPKLLNSCIKNIIYNQNVLTLWLLMYLHPLKSSKHKAVYLPRVHRTAHSVVWVVHCVRGPTVAPHTLAVVFTSHCKVL